ncbi:MAG: TonB-dependent receptor plug domain-containing protein, partial [Cyanophyceae cyanobacterium]
MAGVTVVQPAVAQVTQINQVQIKSVDGNLEVRLGTGDDSVLETFTSRFGKTVTIDLINTQLSLETDDPIIRDNPAPGIASIQVAPLDGNRVRITIAGVDQPPAVEVVEAEGELIVGISTTDTVADQLPNAPEPEVPASEIADDDAIRVLVTGEPIESPYLAPETTFGTRTESSIFEVPQTIQVIPEQLLEDQQIIRLEEAILNVPNAVSGNLGGGASEEVVIRGFSSATFLRAGFRGASDRGAQQGATDLANVERIEVLSGPASVLFGIAEPGGVSNVVTKRPLSEFFAEVGVQLGSFDLVRPTLDVSGRLTENGNLLYRLNASYEFSDDFRDYETDSERFFIAPVLEWRISDRTILTLDLEYRDEKLPFDRGLFAPSGEVLDVPLDTIYGDEEEFIDIESLNVGYRLEQRFNDKWQLRTRFRYT